MAASSARNISWFETREDALLTMRVRVLPASYLIQPVASALAHSGCTLWRASAAIAW
jgi:hypothetical protein